MTTSREIMNRSKFREVFKRSGLDAVVASSLENVFYTSGAQIETQRRLRDRPVFSILTANDEQSLVVCDIEESLARSQTWVADVHVYVEFAQSPTEALAEVLRARGLADKRIGLERRHLHVAYYEELREFLPGAEFVGFDAEFDEIRAIKTAEEVRRLTEAAAATDRAYLRAWGESREGDQERTIARRMMDAVLDLGADSIRFLTFGAGENNKHAHNKPSDRRVKRGDLVRCDFGAYFGAYTSDLARMGVVGEAKPRHVELYHLIRDIERAAIQFMKPGVRACDVYDFCVTEFGKNGIRLSLPHVGHGQLVGGGHENPILHPFNQQQLLPGMALYLELFYVDREEDAFHLEDLVHITESGPKLLSTQMNTDELFVIP